MFAAISRFFGWTKTELHHIVADFHGAVTKIENFIAGKHDEAHALLTEAQDLRAEADTKFSDAIGAFQDASKAEQVKANIQAIINPAPAFSTTENDALAAGVIGTIQAAG